MWSIIYSLWQIFSFPASLFLAMAIIAYKFPKRKGFLFSIPVSLILAAVIGEWINQYFLDFARYSILMAIARSTSCVFLFLVCWLTTLLSWKCNVWEGLFCSTAAYCMEHLSQKVYAVIATCIPEKYTYVSPGLWLLITLAFYIWIIYIFIYRQYELRIMTDNIKQLMVSAVVLLTTILLSVIGGFYAEQYGSVVMQNCIDLFSCVTASLALFIQFMLISNKNMEYERTILEQLLHENESQFQLQKNAIDVINVKCHDLKHQIRNSMENGEIHDIEKAINEYDFVLHTGNKAIDTVLTMKTLQCEKLEILFTCMGDYKSLAFMKDADIYALLGNILDNAIEAVKDLEDPELKVIRFTVERSNAFVVIQCENYYKGTVTFIGGLPESRKEDHNFHGFGTQSIRMITDKYGGDCKFKTTDQVFEVSLIFPL